MEGAKNTNVKRLSSFQHLLSQREATEAVDSAIQERDEALKKVMYEI
jgi:hypothetical protein